MHLHAWLSHEHITGSFVWRWKQAVLHHHWLCQDTTVSASWSSIMRCPKAPRRLIWLGPRSRPKMQLDPLVRELTSLDLCRPDRAAQLDAWQSTRLLGPAEWAVSFQISATCSVRYVSSHERILIKKISGAACKAFIVELALTGTSVAFTSRMINNGFWLWSVLDLDTMIDKQSVSLTCNLSVIGMFSTTDVYTRLCINWLYGRVRGFTITLTAENSPSLVAFVVLFVRFAGS